MLASCAWAQTTLPPGKGKQILDGNCQECHGLEDIVGLNQSSEEWRRSVQRMVRKGAALQPDEIDTLVTYLATYFGPDKTAAPVSASTSKTPIDNDQVKVLLVDVRNHVQTKPHEHKVNRVMVYLQPGSQNFDYEGKKSVLNWKAGEALWSPAAGTHVAEVVSSNPVTIVEIELKKPGVATAAAQPKLDPVAIDPKHYKVEFENDQVRVLRVRIPAHETAPLHTHSLNRVVTYITDQDIEVTTDGKAERVQHKAGEVSWGTAATHKEENKTDKLFEAVVVELKN